MKKLLLPLLLTGLFLFGCHKEDPFEREQKEMDAAISSTTLQPYKAFKVALRGTAATGKDSAFDQARRELLSAMGYVVSASYGSTKPVDLVTAVKSSASLLSAVSLLAKKDEDSLPTVIENFSYLIFPHEEGVKDILSGFLNESEEHAVLGALWVGTPAAPAGMGLYEIQRVKDDELRSVDLRIMMKMARSMMYLQHKWPYHAERSADELVSLIEKEKEYLVQHPWPARDAKGNKVSPEQAWHHLHACSFLLRAMARMQMENKDKEYTDDLALFVKEAQAGGYDDEGMWCIGALVAIKRDNREDALNYLSKLEKSETITPDELEAIKAAKKHVEQKQNGEALTALQDKIAFGKITVNYFAHVLMNSKPVQELNKSESGKKFMGITDLDFGDAASAAENTVDSALEKSKNIIKDLF